MAKLRKHQTWKNWLILLAVNWLEWIEETSRNLRYTILGVKKGKLKYLTQEEMNANTKKLLEYSPEWTIDE